jgi:hypothetical protein
LHRPFAALIPDLPIERVHAGGVGDPRRVRELEHVLQLVPEQREPRIQVWIGFHRHTHVAIVPHRDHELRRGRRRAREPTATDVNDHVALVEPLEQRAKRGRLVAPALERGGQTLVGDAHHRRLGELGMRRRAAGEHDGCGGQQAARGRMTKGSRHQRQYETRRVHDESPVRPQREAAGRTSVRERRRRGRGLHVKNRRASNEIHGEAVLWVCANDAPRVGRSRSGARMRTSRRNPRIRPPPAGRPADTHVDNRVPGKPLSHVSVAQTREAGYAWLSAFVQLHLHRLGIAVLRALDQEHHQERDEGGRGVDRELPGVDFVGRTETSGLAATRGK